MAPEDLCFLLGVQFPLLFPIATIFHVFLPGFELGPYSQGKEVFSGNLGGVLGNARAVSLDTAWPGAIPLNIGESQTG